MFWLYSETPIAFYNFSDKTAVKNLHPKPS